MSKYPEHIYNKYELEFKDIMGDRHFSLVRVYNVLGIKIRVRQKFTYGVTFVSCGYGQSWHRELVSHRTQEKESDEVLRILKTQAELSYLSKLRE